MRTAFARGASTPGFNSPGDEPDDAQDFGGHLMLLQRLSQFVEQARVLNGDDGLSGEVLHERDLLVGEGMDFLAVNDDNAEQLYRP